MAGVKGRSGRRPQATGFRDWCRRIALDPEVQKGIEQEAKENPEFALKVAEHGFGRPPQSLDVSVTRPDRYVIAWGGEDSLPASTTLPDPGPN
jgi:hypothetical protein